MIEIKIRKFLIKNNLISCQSGVTWNGYTCPCQAGWSLFKNSCYRLFVTTRTFADSQSDCGNKNGQIVIINSEDEFNFVNSMRNGVNIWVNLVNS